MSETSDVPTLHRIETVAVELARIAGSEITHALGQSLAIRYKTDEPENHLLRDPVSEADLKVERLIRDRVGEEFPDHAVLGEEFDLHGAPDSEWVWTIDPIDGTSNFVNGFPLFAASIGVLHRGVPVVGALWCATSHALRAGVYHARQGGILRFDENKMERTPNPAVRRLLVGEPRAGLDVGKPWESRKTGSAAVECAFVAAGMMRAARFDSPNVWDVAGGVALVLTAGLEARARDGAGETWVALDGFGASLAKLARWRHPLIVGEPHAVNLMCAGAA